MQTSKRGAAAAGSSAAASMREEMRGLRAAAQVPQRGEIGHGGGGAWALIGTSGRDRAGELRCVVSSRDGNIVSVLLRNEFFHTHCSFYTSQARGSQRPIPLAQNLLGVAVVRRHHPAERERRDTPRSLTLVYQGKPPRSRSTRWMVLSCGSERDGTKRVRSQSTCKSRSRALGDTSESKACLPAQCHNRQSSCGRPAASRQR